MCRSLHAGALQATAREGLAQAPSIRGGNSEIGTRDPPASTQPMRHHAPHVQIILKRQQFQITPFAALLAVQKR